MSEPLTQLQLARERLQDLRRQHEIIEADCNARKRQSWDEIVAAEVEVKELEKKGEGQ